MQMPLAGDDGKGAHRAEIGFTRCIAGGHDLNDAANHRNDSLLRQVMHFQPGDDRILGAVCHPQDFGLATRAGAESMLVPDADASTAQGSTRPTPKV